MPYCTECGRKMLKASDGAKVFYYCTYDGSKLPISDVGGKEIVVIEEISW